MASHTALVAPARTDAVSGQMCQSGGPSLWIPDPDSGELRRTDPASRVWAQHPVSGALVRIRSWRDVRDLARECRRAGTPWEQLVVVTDASASPTQVRASLAGEGPGTAVHTDEDSARGRLRLQVLGPADPSITLDPVEWVAALAADQKRLRQLGAGHVAHTLFGEKTRRDIVAGVGAAMLDRGPQGRLGNRHVVVALAAASADLLSADEIADLLAWPAPDDQLSARAAEHLRTVLGLLPPGQRLRFIESVMVRALNETSTPAERASWYEDWGREHRREEWCPTPGHRCEWGHYDWLGLTPAQVRYMRSAQELVAVAGSRSLYLTWNGRVQSSPFGCLEDRVEHAAFAAQLYASRVGPLPKFTGDVEDDSRRLLDEVIPGVRGWVWNARIVRALGTSVPGVPRSRILLPADESDLSRWGSRMGNCIGDYGVRVDTTGDVLGAVSVDGCVEVTFQLRSDAGSLVMGQLGGRFGKDRLSLLAPVRRHLREVLDQLPAGLVTATAMPPRIPGEAEPVIGTTESLDVADRLEDAMDERVAPRCRRTAGGRRRRVRQDSQPAPLGVLGRIASDAQMSRIAAEAVRSMEPKDRAALSFGMSSHRSIADVLEIAAAVSPADAWIVPGAGPLLSELLDQFPGLAVEELARRWDEIAPFGHSPQVDHAVRALLVTILDGSLSESLVRTLDRDGESVAVRIFRAEFVEWRCPARARRLFDEAMRRTGLRPRTRNRKRLR